MMGESLRNRPKITLGAVQKACGRQLVRMLVAAAIVTSGMPAAAQHTAARDTAAREDSQPSAAQPAPESTQPAAVGDDATRAAPLAASAAGEAALDERAQRHWGSGMAYLDEDNYAKALEAFEKAYELSGRPRVLLAIAVTHERRGDLGQAIATLDEYLRLAPTADNAESIRAHRDELQAQHDEQLQRMSDAKKVEGTGADTGKTRVVPRAVDGSSPSGEATHDPRVSRRSDTLKWTAFGVGVASGVAATVSGLLALKKYEELDDGCGGAGFCTERDTQTGRTMAWVSTVLTGVAVAGLGVGVWLTLDEPDGPDPRRNAAQRVHVGLAYRPSGLTSEVSWSF
jgi:tetratricopeptide (TPR) repeat protein